MLTPFAYVHIQRRQRHGRGSRKTQTAPFTARLFAAAELGPPACWSWPRVRRTLSPAPGNPSLLLCQRPQKSLLLPRLWSGRRSPALCSVVPPAVLPSKPRLPPAAQCSSSRSHRRARDRKSTRLNSSHGYISYAVFCLKKKISSYTATTSISLCVILYPCSVLTV